MKRLNYEERTEKKRKEKRKRKSKATLAPKMFASFALKSPSSEAVLMMVEEEPVSAKSAASHLEKAGCNFISGGQVSPEQSFSATFFQGLRIERMRSWGIHLKKKEEKYVSI